MASKVFDFVDTLQSIHTIHAYCKFKFVGVFITHKLTHATPFNH